jgi:hypothetical protein
MTVTRDSEHVAMSVGQTFVSYAREDEAFAITVAAAMRDRGVEIWIDRWNIEPGADWNKAIDAALNACANFLIVLSPEAVRSDEVAGELRVALNDQRHVVPVLYRPCEIPRQLLLIHYLDFTQSPEPSVALLDALARALRDQGDRRDIALFSDRDRRSRQTLLQDVKSEASARLRSIGLDTPLPILLEQQPHQVERAWDDEGAVFARQHRRPPVTNIVAVFDDAAVGGKLLILGAPGSGKTTAVLQLMRELAARAELDEGQPIPVMVSLASWDGEKPFAEWFVDELKAKYGVRQDLGAHWRDEGVIAPLFDGLDELPAERQQAGVEVINRFQHEQQPRWLVVSSRRAEYENLAIKLRLGGAVCLMPLETEQIRAYLEQTASADLWNAIRGDPPLMEMARSPLLLSFMSAFPDETEVQRWQDAPSAIERRRRVFDAYVSSRASSGATSRVYSQEQTLRWLRQLATTLKNQGQSEFLIERMQPEWLQSPLQRWSYRAGVSMASAVVVGVVMQSAYALFELVPRGNVGLALQSTFSSLGSGLNQPLLLGIALAVGVFIASRKKIVPVETLTWSWSRAWRNTRKWARTATLAGLDYGASAGVAAGLMWLLTTAADAPRTAAQIVGTLGCASAAVFLVLIKPSAWLQDVRRPEMRPRIVEALTAAVSLALVSGWVLFWDVKLHEIFVLAASDVLAAIGLFVAVGFSAVSNDRCRVWVQRGWLAGLTCGAAIGVLAAPAKPPAAAFLLWLGVWVAGGFAVGLIAGMVIGLTVRAKEWIESRQVSARANIGWSPRRTASAILAMSMMLGLAALVSSQAGADQPIRTIASLIASVQGTLLNALVLMALCAMTGAAAGAVTAGLLGALAGAVGGATGVDVERRLVPNQGIHQSAVNVAIFAALGTLIIGVPYGLLNLSIAALVTANLPTSGDWLKLGVGAGAAFGLLAGLLPGAACIQHFILRLVLWVSGTLPLRYVKFLNFATRRRLLQRVGGRYRFIHVLLRDYLGDAAQARTAA